VECVPPPAGLSLAGLTRAGDPEAHVLRIAATSSVGAACPRRGAYVLGNRMRHVVAGEPAPTLRQIALP